MFILKKIPLLAALIYSTFTIGQNQSFTMDEAVSYAQQNHLSVQQARIDYDRSKQQVREYTSIGLPKANAFLNYNYNINLPTQLLPDFLTPAVVGTLERFSLVPAGTTNNLPAGQPQPVKFGTNNNLTFGVNINTLIFDGSYFVGLKAAKGLVDMTNRQTDLSIQQVKYNVKKAYLTVLIAEENKKTLDRNVENLEKLYSETKAYKENGLIEQLDVDRLELALSNLKTESEMVDRQITLAYSVLKFQMNYPLDQKIILKDVLTQLTQEPSASDLKGIFDVSTRIEYDILKKSEYLNDLNIRRYKMGYAPSLSGFFTHQYQIQRNDLFDKDEAGLFPITITGISLNVPIFDGFEKDSRIKMAQLDKSKIGLQMKQFESAVQLEINNARVTYNNAKQRLANQKKNVDLAERILNTTKIKYKEGVGSSMEITNAEQELYRTQAAYMNALYDLAIAKTDLEKALGK